MIQWTWLLTLASLIGTILNIKKKKVCFWIWLFTNALWAMVDFHKGLPAQGVLFTIYTGLAIWGVYEWRHNEKNREQYDKKT